MTRFAAIVTSGILALGLAGCATPQRLERSPLRLAAAKPGTTVEFQAAVRAQCIDIRCPAGIGWAAIVIPPDTMMDPVVVRLHLRGLELLRVDCGGCSQLVAVSSHGAPAIRRWREDGKPLAAGDSIALSLVPSTGTSPRIPLEGWFEFTLPVSCKASGAVRLSWVDFYR